MDIKQIEEDFLQKVKSQDKIPTFFDNLVFDTIQDNNPGEAEEAILSWLINSRENRFSDYRDRVNRVRKIHNPFYGPLLFASQGTHTVLSWKGMPIFKSVLDMALYTLIISEIKPEVIVEYGSGNGTSAIWLSDMCAALGVNTQIFSYDIQEVKIQHPNIIFRTLDLANLCLDKEELVGKKLIIEDAHNHVGSVLLETDKVLNSGDYLFVEDSDSKHEDLLNLVNKGTKEYVVDNFLIDFFGINMSSACNSIFKVV